MHLRIIAVGDRQPSWVGAAVAAYADRLPPQWKFGIDEVPAAQRSKSRGGEAAMVAEANKIASRLQREEFVVLLDERGSALSSRQLSERLSKWQMNARQLTFIVGGPDGVADSVRERADFTLSLSALTLPHGLARVLLVEQLYRAWSLLQGHPYHRD